MGFALLSHVAFCFFCFYGATFAWPTRTACPMQKRREAQTWVLWRKHCCALRPWSCLPSMHAFVRQCASPDNMDCTNSWVLFFSLAKFDIACALDVFWSTGACKRSCIAIV